MDVRDIGVSEVNTSSFMVEVFNAVAFETP
jgi:hypothetical protein